LLGKKGYVVVVVVVASFDEPSTTYFFDQNNKKIQQAEGSQRYEEKDCKHMFTDKEPHKKSSVLSKQ